VYLSANDVLPQLFISTKESKSIAKELVNCHGSIEKSVRLRDISSFADVEKDFIQSRSFKALSKPARVLSLSTCERDKENIIRSGDWMTVPIFSRSASHIGGLTFEEDSSIQMIRNLAKSVRSGKEFSLRSCIRIRGAGHSRIFRDQISASLRFEAVLPNLSFQCTQLHPIPFLKTPLASVLHSRSVADSHRFGYLTLNRTRKLVPILESDPCVATAPLVGLWLAGLSGPENELVKHPLVWAACVRFLNFEGLRERVFVAENTFLLVRELQRMNWLYF